MYGCEGESGGCIKRDVGEGGWSGGTAGLGSFNLLDGEVADGKRGISVAGINSRIALPGPPQILISQIASTATTRRCCFCVKSVGCQE